MLYILRPSVMGTMMRSYKEPCVSYTCFIMGHATDWMRSVLRLKSAMATWKAFSARSSRFSLASCSSVNGTSMARILRFPTRSQMMLDMSMPMRSPIRAWRRFS